MFERGIPIHSTVRKLAKQLAWPHDYDIDNRRWFFTPLPLELLNKIDSLAITAQRKLTDFCLKSDRTQYSADWSLVREYKTPGTAFLYRTDRIAPDSIVVKKTYLNNHHTLTQVYWISPEREKKWGLPFLYEITLPSEHVNPNFITNLFKAKLSDNILCSTREAAEKAENFFATQQPEFPRTLFTFEVWKQGKALTMNSQKIEDSKLFKIPHRQPEVVSI